MKTLEDIWFPRSLNLQFFTLVQIGSLLPSATATPDTQKGVQLHQLHALIEYQIQIKVTETNANNDADGDDAEEANEEGAARRQ